MDTAEHPRDRRQRRSLSAHERWKDGWGAVLRASVLAAAAAHLALFAAWPARDVSPPETPDPFRGMQVVTIAAHPPPPAPQDNSSRLQPVARELEISENRDQSDDLIDALLEKLNRRPPALASSLSPAETPAFAARTERISGEGLTVNLMPGASQRPFTWPEIRNPRELVRFLRSRYNPIHTHAEAQREVGVAIWIDERGAVEWSEVRESSGHSAVDEIALAAVNEVIKFTPGSREGIPSPVGVVLSIPFQIRW